MRFTKILSGFIAINVLLVILSALFFARPAAGGMSTPLLAAWLGGVLLFTSIVCAVMIKGVALPLNNLIQHLGGEAHGLEDAATRLNATAQAMSDNSVRNFTALEEAAASLSRVSAIILHGVDDLTEARAAMAEISALVTRAGEALGEIDTNVRLNSSAASDINAEAIHLSAKADELTEALRELSALLHGGEPLGDREPSLKSTLARQMLVKALPVAETP